MPNLQITRRETHSHRQVGLCRGISQMLFKRQHDRTLGRFSSLIFGTGSPSSQPELDERVALLETTEALNAKGVSESISPLPNFRKRLSVCESAGLGECVSVYLYRKVLVLTDDTGGDSLSEVDVFGVGAPVQYICSAACTKQLSFPSIVSSKNEVPSRNDLDISRTFGELLTVNQLPGTIQLTLLCLAAVCL
jgi:hypothetical protein